MPVNFQNIEFGVEIEFTGLYIGNVRRIIKDTLNGRYNNDIDVVDNQNRVWQIKFDGSVSSRNGDSMEIATPILTYQDVPTLQKVVRKLRAAGAEVNTSCGLHIHVSTKTHDLQSLKNVINLYRSNEDTLYSVLNVHHSRMNSYAPKVGVNYEHDSNSAFSIEDLVNNKFPRRKHMGMNLTKLRVHGINRGTIEYRLFNSTLHAGEIRSYITLVLKMNEYAINNNSVLFQTVQVNEQNMQAFLNEINITNDDELTKNVYRHLMKEFNEVISQVS